MVGSRTLSIIPTRNSVYKSGSCVTGPQEIVGRPFTRDVMYGEDE